MEPANKTGWKGISTPSGVDIVGAEARERRRQQLIREAEKAVLLVAIGAIAAGLIGVQANSIPVRTNSDFVAAQNLRALAVFAFMIALATWAAWFRRPSPRLRMIVNLAELAVTCGKILDMQGEARRRRKRRELLRKTRAAYLATPSRHNYKTDLFYGPHHKLFQLVETSLLTLEWRARKKRFDELVGKDLPKIADSIAHVVMSLWSTENEINQETLARTVELSEAIGKPPRSPYEKIRGALSVISIREIVKAFGFLILGIGISASVLVPAVIFLGSSPESILLATIALGAAIAGLLQSTQRRQRD